MQFWNIIKIILLISVLALLGFNIFTYLAKGTDVFGNYLSFAGKKVEKGAEKTIKYIGVGAKATGKATGKALKNTGSGVKRGVKTIDSKLSRTVDGRTTSKSSAQPSTNSKKASVPPPPPAVAPPGRPTPPSNGQQRPSPQVQPDSSADSEIQRNNQKGFCYIGSWGGVRSCISVKKSSECLSGNIFPTKAICRHPNLRQ